MKIRIEIMHFLIFILLQCGESRKKSKVLLFTQTRTNYNPDYVDEYYVNIKAENASLDFGFTLNKNLPHDLWVILAIVARSRIIYAYDVNVCNVLRSEWANKLNIINFWLQNVFIRYGNLPKSCPIKKGTYTWNDVKTDRNSIPSFATSGKYIANVMFYMQKEKAKEMVMNCSLDLVIT